MSAEKSNQGRQKSGNKENVCRKKAIKADRKEEIQKMSAGKKLIRQTKKRKYRKCLPKKSNQGRQKRGNTENVCRKKDRSRPANREGTMAFDYNSRTSWEKGKVEAWEKAHKKQISKSGSLGKGAQKTDQQDREKQ